MTTDSKVIIITTDCWFYNINRCNIFDNIYYATEKREGD